MFPFILILPLKCISYFCVYVFLSAYMYVTLHHFPALSYDFVYNDLKDGYHGKYPFFVV